MRGAPLACAQWRAVQGRHDPTEQEAFCSVDAHTDEWGPQGTTLTDNARTGLEQVYLALAGRAGAPASIPPNVQAAIDAFSANPDARVRVAIATDLCARR